MPYGTDSGSTHRRAWFVSASNALRCVREHRIPEDKVTPLILEHGGVRCSARMNFHPGDRPTECGAFMWVLQMPGGWRFVAEVTIDELKRAGELHLNIDQMFEFLGLEGEMISLPTGTKHAVEQATEQRRRA